MARAAELTPHRQTAITELAAFLDAPECVWRAWAGNNL